MHLLPVGNANKLHVLANTRIEGEMEVGDHTYLADDVLSDSEN